jgi:hypothetical protein
MRIIILPMVLVYFLSLAGCATGSDTHKVTCSGAEMSVCFNKALNKCPQGWTPVGQASGKALKFRCNSG